MNKHTSELDAVNAILRSIGEAPVQTLDDSDLVDAHMARQILHETSREVQGEGWAWNTVTRRTFKPNFRGEIQLPKKVLWVRGFGRHRGLIKVGERLQDMVTGETEFDGDVEVEAVYCRDWEELPETARRYIVIRSARRFAEETVGSETLSAFKSQDEILARADLVDMETEVRQPNMKDSFDVWEMTEGRGTLKTGLRR